MSEETLGAEYRVYEELFRGLTQFAPGSRETTHAVLEQVRGRLPAAPAVADMGCGVGASTLVLAKAMPRATIVAVDMYEPFLATLRELARLSGVGDRIDARLGDMVDVRSVALEPESLDLIWSEAAAYAVGVERALAAWTPLLKPGGLVVFSELVWSVAAALRPPAAVALWGREYPAMRMADEVEALVAAARLVSLGRRPVPRAGWEGYYGPLRARVAALRAKAAPDSAEAALLAGMQEEIDVFDEYGATFAYEFFVAEKSS